MALSVGSAVKGQISGAATNTVASASLTSASGDVNIACIATADGSTLRTVSSVAGSSLTWTKHKNITGTTSAFAQGSCEIWSSTGASSAAVTATLSGNVEAASITCFAISGANTTTRFDADASIPATASELTGAGTHPSATISTANANTVLLGFFSGPGRGDPGGVTVPTGFTSLNYEDAFSGSPSFRSCLVFVSYKIVSATQSGLAVAYTGSTVLDWLDVTTAVQQAAAGGIPNKVYQVNFAVKRAAHY